MKKITFLQKTPYISPSFPKIHFALYRRFLEASTFYHILVLTVSDVRNNSNKYCKSTNNVMKSEYLKKLCNREHQFLLK